MGEARRRMKTQFEAGDTVDQSSMDERRKLRFEKDVCDKVAEILQKNYPGYTWAIRCDIYVERESRTLIGVIERQPGAVQIQIPAIMPPTKMYNIPIGMLNTENDFQRLVMRAGGELLERFGLARSGIDFDTFEAARPVMQLDHRSEMKH